MGKKLEVANSDDLSDLRNECEILRLIYWRNKNQHRGQYWWSYFAILNRRLSQMVSKEKLDSDVVNYIVKKLVPSLWKALHSMLAQGSFVTLGFAILAATARVWKILESHVSFIRVYTSKPPMLSMAEEDDLGEAVDQQNLLLFETLKRNQPVIMQPTAKSGHVQKKSIKDLKKTKKSKTSKKRNAIDDIFGT